MPTTLPVGRAAPAPPGLLLLLLTASEGSTDSGPCVCVFWGGGQAKGTNGGGGKFLRSWGVSILKHICIIPATFAKICQEPGCPAADLYLTGPGFVDPSLTANISTGGMSAASAAAADPSGDSGGDSSPAAAAAAALPPASTLLGRFHSDSCSNSTATTSPVDNMITTAGEGGGWERVRG
jgi:hypothetical protein